MAAYANKYLEIMAFSPPINNGIFTSNNPENHSSF